MGRIPTPSCSKVAEGVAASPIGYVNYMVHLPDARGSLSAFVLHHLAQPVHPVPAMPVAVDDPLVGDDFHLALYLLYELHYRGLPDVDEPWEWEPSLLAMRRELERRFTGALIDDNSPLGSGPSLSTYMAE